MATYQYGEISPNIISYTPKKTGGATVKVIERSRTIVGSRSSSPSQALSNLEQKKLIQAQARQIRMRNLRRK